MARSSWPDHLDAQAQGRVSAPIGLRWHLSPKAGYVTSSSSFGPSKGSELRDLNTQMPSILIVFFERDRRPLSIATWENISTRLISRKLQRKFGPRGASGNLPVKQTPRTYFSVHYIHVPSKRRCWGAWVKSVRALMKPCSWGERPVSDSIVWAVNGLDDHLTHLGDFVLETFPPLRLFPHRK